jgi:glycosyltransferase involved in cell wall biosynthesis
MTETVPRKTRVLVFIVAYNAERTIQNVIRRIPLSLTEYETEILIIDDSSRDRTFEAAHTYNRSDLPFRLTVLFNPVNQGYGGNQKLGFHYALEKGFDIVALVHGDGQYAPECLPDLLQPLIDGEADAVFGSRMLSRFGALNGGMPLYKYVGNKVLTTFQNWMLGSSLSEFHSGYRLYSIAALRRIPFERNTNDFHFDTDIIIQLLRANLRIRELPIPTYYGDEICYVNGMKYAWDVFKTTLVARSQDLGVFYERKFDVLGEDEANPLYQSKLGYNSPHSMTVARVQGGTAVLDVGCASGYIALALKEKDCHVTGIDQFPITDRATVDDFVQHDLNLPLPFDTSGFDYVLLLDIIEHLRSPELFLESLRAHRLRNRRTTLIVSTGNIAFLITRMMLLLGWFNYGKRGILDLTHTRLFTFSSLIRLFEQAGYRIEEVQGVPAPFPLALGDSYLARVLLAANKLFIRVSRALFAYQIFLTARPMPSVQSLLETAADASTKRMANAPERRDPVASYAAAQ